MTGCNNDEAATEDRIRQAGYYSTEKDQLVQNMSNQAPMTKMLAGFYHDNHSYSSVDRNYHGHESKPLRAKSSYYNSYEGKLVDDILIRVNKVNHVIDSRAIVTKDEVLVTVLLDDYRHAQTVKNEVENSAKQIVHNRTLHVSTDQGLYYRSMVLDNNLRDGLPTDRIIMDVDDMLDNLSLHEDHLQ